MKKIFIALLILSATLFAQNYKQVKIQLNDIQKDISTLSQFDIDIEHAETTKDGSIIVFVSDEEYSRLSLLPFKVDVLIDDWFDYYSKQPQLSDAEKKQVLEETYSLTNVTGFGYGSMGGYYTFNEVIAELDSMFMLYPNLITQKVSIGNSIEGRPIYVVKISDNPNIDENEPEVLYTALHHAREPQGMMALIYYMYYLLENYESNPEVNYLVNNRAIYFIPVLNPDGYEYNRSTNPNGGGMWRKNRRNNSGSYGVDLNRNYGPMAYWDAPNGGSSTSPSSETYRGTAPFSEPETNAIQNFLNSRKFKNTLNYHTYSNLLIYPYGALSRETPDSLIFREYAIDMTRFNGYTYGTDMQTVGYSTRGNSDDYFYDGDTTMRGKIFAMTPEVGSSSDGFWPAQARIFPLAIENLKPNLYYAWVAGEYVSLANVNYNQQFFNPGDNVTMNYSLKNKGLSSASNVTVTLTTSDPYITITNGNNVVGNIPARGIIGDTNPFTFSISPSAPIDYMVKLVVKSFTGAVMMTSDTLSFILGTPQYTFFDTTDAALSKWTVTASPTTPKWESTNTTYYSASLSITDSKTGNYANSATVTLRSTNPISLSGMNNPRLSYWTKWDIESSWDCGVVSISTNNGSTWINLQGAYSRPASGNGKQTPAGMPIYDGVQSNWVREEISLSAYAGQNILLRFELRTDGSVVKDGWYLDDIGIYTYSVVPVELISFTANEDANGVHLNWITASEQNNRGFEIQRKAIGEEWVTIGFIEGKGTTAEKQNYSFTDNSSLTGLILYRLKQFDFDGSINYSPTVEIDLKPVYTFALEQNYPNPFNPSTTISFSLPEDNYVTLKIYDILGKEAAVLIDKELKEPGAYNYQLSIDNYQLTSGVYFYQLRAGNLVETKKMVLLK